MVFKSSIVIECLCNSYPLNKWSATLPFCVLHIFLSTIMIESPKKLFSPAYSSIRKDPHFDDLFEHVEMPDLVHMVEMMDVISDGCRTGRASLNTIKRKMAWNDSSHRPREQYLHLVAHACATDVQCWILLVRHWLTAGEVMGGCDKDYSLKDLDTVLADTSASSCKIYWELLTDEWAATKTQLEYLSLVRAWRTYAICLRFSISNNTACQDPSCLLGRGNHDFTGCSRCSLLTLKDFQYRFSQRPKRHYASQ